MSVLDYARANVRGSTAIADLLLQLSVFDPTRGELTKENIRIDRPDVKVFQSTQELSSLKAKDKQDKKTKKIKEKKKRHAEPEDK